MFSQLANTLVTIFTALNFIAVLALFFYFKSLFLRKFPGRDKIASLDMEVGAFNGAIADLTDRFNRFQRKENMRQVRAERTAEQDVLAQAREIVAETAPAAAGDETDEKLSLYRKLGRPN